MSQKDFDEKINSLLSHTVPLVHENELNGHFENNDFILLDTRSLEEYEVSHLKGARFIDYDSFEPRMVNDISKSKPVVLYCSVGYRSEKIGERLQELGFKNVYNLYGGIFDWKNKDNSVVNQKNLETDSVHTYNKSWSKWLKKGIKVYE
ncbi:MAG: rhodanese-like domain-containing protein [Bacteroidota bacterium]